MRLVRHIKTLFIALVASLSIAATAVKAEIIFEVSADSTSYNEILLEQPFVDALFDVQKNIQGKPLIMNNNQNMLFRVKKGVTQPFNLFMVMSDGSRKKFKIIPNEKIDSQTWPSESAGVRTVMDKVTFTDSPRKQYFINLLKQLHKIDKKTGKHTLPAGFALEKASDVAYYGPILIREVKRMSNSIHQISVYALSSKHPTPVTPADFYRNDVIAVELNVDIVGPDESNLVVISKIVEEQ